MKIKTNAPDIIKWAIETDTILLTKTDQSKGGRKMDTKTIYRTVMTILGLTAMIAFLVGGGISVSAKKPPVTEVYPTGIYPDDVIAIQNAVDANPGGKVVLMATGTPFHLGDDTTGRGIVQITNAVTIEGETVAPYSITLPNGETLDKVKLPVVYGGGAEGWLGTGTFNINAWDGEETYYYSTVKDIAFYGSGFSAISVQNCDGAMISGNKVFNPLPKDILGWQYWGIAVSEAWGMLGGPKCSVKGPVTIKNNNIRLSEYEESYYGAGIIVIATLSNAKFLIKNNTVYNPTDLGIGTFDCPYSTATIEGNTVVGSEICVQGGPFFGFGAGETKILDNTLEADEGHPTASCIFFVAKDSVIKNNTLNRPLVLFQGENNVVEHNRISIAASPLQRHGIEIADGGNYHKIIGNTIRGSAEYGIECIEGAHDNIFEKNDLKHLEVTEAHVYLDSETYNNVFVKNKPKDMIVIDEGTNNQIDDKGKAAPASLLSKLAFAAPPAYPQPCNPETWIPYTLAKDVEVTITIYSSSGRIIRALNLGHQKAGAYISKNRAAYWDGRNENGEKVSSGVYFYTLRAGDFRATRKMVILR